MRQNIQQGRGQQYSAKSKRESEYYLKVYDKDVALNFIRIMNNRYDLTHNFANVVYNELLYMGYHLQVYHCGSQEVNFVANKGNKQYHIQTAYSMTEGRVYEGEFGAFVKPDSSYQKIVITNDDIDFITNTICHIRFRGFVQMDKM